MSFGHADTPGIEKYGVTSHQPLQLGVYPKTRITGKLSDLSRDYFIFTPGILYLYGGFNDALWHDVSSIKPLDLRFHLSESEPLFAGLEAPNGDKLWNHGTFLVPLADKDRVILALSAWMGVNYDLKKICLTKRQELTVLLNVKVGAFTASTSAGHFAFDVAKTPPTVDRFRPQLETTTAETTFFASSATADDLINKLAVNPRNSEGQLVLPTAPQLPKPGPLTELPQWVRGRFSPRR